VQAAGLYIVSLSACIDNIGSDAGVKDVFYFMFQDEATSNEVLFAANSGDSNTTLCLTASRTLYLNEGGTVRLQYLWTTTNRPLKVYCINSTIAQTA
jgi:hypothetical protein